MFTQQREAVKGEMQQALHDYMQVIASWMDEDTGAIEDRFDSIYSENYTAGTAGVIFANGYAFSGRPEHRDAALKLIRRAAKVRIKDMNVAPFARMFIYHYAMMALLMLPEEERNRHKAEFADDFLHGEPQDCGTINLNCAALQLGNELFLESLGYRKADAAFMEKLIKLMEEREKDGFLNDAFDHQDQVNFREHDGMPIAYSIFILFILTAVMAAVGEWNPAYAEMRTRVETLIEKGQSWMNHATSSDGTFAMMERSRHQMFTWGSFLAYNAYAGMADAELFAKAFREWLQYKKEDGTYSMTPNFLPHELRVGYEWYTLVNCYGILGMTGLSVAERIVRRGLHMPQANDRAPLPAHNQYADLRSGYAFVRAGDDFFAANLRLHHGKYGAALSGFHYRLGGVKPPLAESKINPKRIAATPYFQNYDIGVWEGYLLRDAEGGCAYPDMTATPEVEWVDRGIAMTVEDDNVACRKTIRLTGSGIEWSYKLTAKRAFVSCEHIIPLLMTDGKNGTRLERRLANGWLVSYAGRRYEIASAACDNALRTADAVYSVQNNLSYERSLLSVSGVSAQLSLVVSSGPLAEGDELAWSTTLTVLT
ncbi:MAG: hypothetical protein J7639_22880 [Paenibacillaceae bacterium]|nr:hypothetical protein [Paenibacillaceae bacterium]